MLPVFLGNRNQHIPVVSKEPCICGGRTLSNHTSSELQSNAQLRDCLRLQRQQRSTAEQQQQQQQQQWYNNSGTTTPPRHALFFATATVISCFFVRVQCSLELHPTKISPQTGTRHKSETSPDPGNGYPAGIAGTGHTPAGTRGPITRVLLNGCPGDYALLKRRISHSLNGTNKAE